MDRSWIAVGISLVALGCSGASLLVTLRQLPSATPEISDRTPADPALDPPVDRSPEQASRSEPADAPVSLTRVRPDRSSSELQTPFETATPDPVEAFQAQLIRNEEILRQLREGELTRSQDQ